MSSFLLAALILSGLALIGLLFTAALTLWDQYVEPYENEHPYHRNSGKTPASDNVQ
jgi:hypothetical protein